MFPKLNLYEHLFGFQAGIRLSIQWKDTRLHWELDQAYIFVSCLKLFRFSLKLSKQAIHTVEKWFLMRSLSNGLVGGFKVTLLKVQYLPVFLN